MKPFYYFSQMIRIVIIGSGNVAQHLISAFKKSTDIEVIQVYSRSNNLDNSIISSEKVTNDITAIKEADLYIISVTDNSIAEVSGNLPFNNKLVVHTSGTTSMDILNNKNRKGVFYPLQTFTKGKEVDFKEIPICLEAQNEEDYTFLQKVAQTISEKAIKITSEQRKAIHVSAVFVCNFVNHLYQIGNEICMQNNIPFEILHPLIEETANKIKTLSPIEAQTGPAKRNDTETINTHLNFLSNETNKEIYKLLTKSIIDTHVKKL